MSSGSLYIGYSPANGLMAAFHALAGNVDSASSPLTLDQSTHGEQTLKKKTKIVIIESNTDIQDDVSLDPEDSAV